MSTHREQGRRSGRGRGNLLSSCFLLVTAFTTVANSIAFSPPWSSSSSSSDSGSPAQEIEITNANREECLAKLLCGMSVALIQNDQDKTLAEIQNGPVYTEYSQIIKNYFATSDPQNDETAVSSESFESAEALASADYALDEVAKPEVGLKPFPRRPNFPAEFAAVPPTTTTTSSAQPPLPSTLPIQPTHEVEVEPDSSPEVSSEMAIVPAAPAPQPFVVGTVPATGESQHQQQVAPDEPPTWTTLPPSPPIDPISTQAPINPVVIKVYSNVPVGEAIRAPTVAPFVGIDNLDRAAIYIPRRRRGAEEFDNVFNSKMVRAAKKVMTDAGLEMKKLKTIRQCQKIVGCSYTFKQLYQTYGGKGNFNPKPVTKYRQPPAAAAPSATKDFQTQTLQPGRPLVPDFFNYGGVNSNNNAPVRPPQPYAPSHGGPTNWFNTPKQPESDSLEDDIEADQEPQFDASSFHGSSSKFPELGGFFQSNSANSAHQFSAIRRPMKKQKNRFNYNKVKVPAGHAQTPARRKRPSAVVAMPPPLQKQPKRPLTVRPQKPPTSASRRPKPPKSDKFPPTTTTTTPKPRRGIRTTPRPKKVTVQYKSATNAENGRRKYYPGNDEDFDDDINKTLPVQLVGTKYDAQPNSHSQEGGSNESAHDDYDEEEKYETPTDYGNDEEDDDEDDDGDDDDDDESDERKLKVEKTKKPKPESKDQKDGQQASDGQKSDPTPAAKPVTELPALAAFDPAPKKKPGSSKEQQNPKDESESDENDDDADDEAGGGSKKSGRHPPTIYREAIYPAQIGGRPVSASEDVPTYMTSMMGSRRTTYDAARNPVVNAGNSGYGVGVGGRVPPSYSGKQQSTMSQSQQSQGHGNQPSTSKRFQQSMTPQATHSQMQQQHQHHDDSVPSMTSGFPKSPLMSFSGLPILKHIFKPLSAPEEFSHGQGANSNTNSGPHFSAHAHTQGGYPRQPPPPPPPRPQQSQHSSPYHQNRPGPGPGSGPPPPPPPSSVRHPQSGHGPSGAVRNPGIIPQMPPGPASSNYRRNSQEKKSKSSSKSKRTKKVKATQRPTAVSPTAAGKKKWKGRL